MDSIVISPLSPDRREELCSLWCGAFHDDDDFISDFCRRFLSPGAGAQAISDDAVLSAGWLLGGFSLSVPGSETLPLGYLYALATLPEARGRGLGSLVTAEIVRLSEQRGDAMCCTLPAEPGLYAYYRACGFKTITRACETAVVPALGHNAPARKVDAEEYLFLRERLLSSTPHISLSTELMDWQNSFPGGLYDLGSAGIACVESDGSSVSVKELLSPRRALADALSSLAPIFGGGEYTVRTPVFWGIGPERDFVMAFGPAASDILPDTWWGPAFD